MSRYKIVIPILIFSFLFCYTLFDQTFVANNKIKVDFNFANWITFESDSDIQYFREDFYISEKVKNAWVKISASDSYEIYVNGKLVGKGVENGWFPSNIYDLTSILNIGRNVLSIKSVIRKIEGEPKIIAEIGYETFSNNKSYVYTSDKWKAADFINITSPSGHKWYENDFNDSNWSGAASTVGPEKIVLENDPEIFKSAVDYKQLFWVGSSRQIICNSEIEISGLPESAWIRLLPMGDFKVGINGDLIDSVFTGVVPVDEGEVNSGGSILYIYNLDSELKKGRNLITINSYASDNGKGLYVDGLISGKGWKKELNAEDFKCHNSQNTKFAEKTFLAPGMLSVEQKIIRDNYSKYSVNVLEILKLIILVLIFGASFLFITFQFSNKFGIPLDSLSSTYLLPTLYLISLILFTFDINFVVYDLIGHWQVVLSLGLLVLAWVVFLILKKFEITEINYKVSYLALVAILLIGFFLRLENINSEGLHWDEAQMFEKTDGVLDRGYPSLEFSDGTPRYIATSELVVYIQSLSVSLLGQNIFSLRIPSLIFGILTIGLLFFFGKLIGGYRVGLLSSAVYSVLPPAIGMSVFARYPSQLTFFSLLSAYLFLRYFYGKQLKFWILTGVSILFSYFSWQASVFISLPIVFSRLLLLGRPKLIRDAAYFILILGIPVSAHIVLKKLSKQSIEHYSLLGPSLSLTTFRFNFLDSTYDPFFYINNFLFVEGYHFLTFLFLIGIPLLFYKNKKRLDLLFLYFVVGSVFFIMTAVLANNTYRYAYYLLPFLILISSSVFIYLTDNLYRSEESSYFRMLNFVITFIFFVLFTSGAANFQNFPLFREGLKTNIELRNFPDFKKASDFLNSNVKEEDVVITMVPHLQNYYFDKLDFFFESRLQVAVFKNYGDGSTKAFHKVVPIPAILSLGELKNVVYSTKGNVWLVASPERYKLFDEDTIKFLEGNRKLVFESYEANIYHINK